MALVVGETVAAGGLLEPCCARAVPP